jgi:hypothetical protein
MRITGLNPVPDKATPDIQTLFTSYPFDTFKGQLSAKLQAHIKLISLCHVYKTSYA